MHTHTNDAAPITNGHGPVGGVGGGAGGSTEGKIRCIFLSEFDATAGSKISCQVSAFPG